MAFNLIPYGLVSEKLAQESPINKQPALGNLKDSTIPCVESRLDTAVNREGWVNTPTGWKELHCMSQHEQCLWDSQAVFPRIRIDTVSSRSRSWARWAP